ncbi:hypothetical protein JCM8202v2_005639 [Rhodotorula sphaerocarpa]
MSAILSPVPTSLPTSTRHGAATERTELPRPAARPTKRTKRMLATTDELHEWEAETARLTQQRRAGSPPRPPREAPARGPDVDSGAGTVREEEPEDVGLQPISGMQPPAGRTDASDPKAPTTARRTPVAAVYDLSSLAPSRPPKAETSRSAGPAEAAPPPRARRSAEPLSRLSDRIAPIAVPGAGRQGGGGGGGSATAPESKPPQALSSLRPPPPTQAATALHPDGTGWEGGIETEEWSPKKRKAGYLASGMAARAARVLASARTEQTLWLHETARRLAAHAAKTADAAGPTSAATGSRNTSAALRNELQPDLRFTVLEVLSFGSDEADSFMTPDRRRERRTTLTTCRFVVDPLESSDPLPSDASQPTRETQGLVLFSLHDRLGPSGSGSGSASSASSAAPVLPSPPKRSAMDGGTDTRSGNPASPRSREGRARSLFPPSRPT